MTKDSIRMKQLQEEIDGLTDRLKRALADYQNLEKRVTAEKEEFAKFANTQLLLKILSALDSIERAEAHLKDEGLSLAVRQLREGLAASGLEKIEVKRGENFDPDLMECIEVAPGEEGKVLDERRTGYKLNSRVLRVAQVKVGKSKMEEGAVGKAKPELTKGDYL